MKEKVRINFDINKELHKKIKLICAEKGITMSKLFLRSAIRYLEWLSKYDDKLS